MSFFKKKRLVIATLIYWFLLVYIIVALVWWFIALQQQNRQMANLKMQQLRLDDPSYMTRVDQIYLEENRKTAQYVGEGATFLVLFLTGAIFVYFPVRRQIKLQQQQQNFMMAVTHELKTPIAVVRLDLETLQKYKLDEQKQQKIIQSSLQETNRLDTLANNILVSAQLDGGAYNLSKDELNFSALTYSAANDYRNRFPERRWLINIEPHLSVLGDDRLLQMLVNNLIENAVKYSSKEAPITIDLKKEKIHIILKVKDQGQGIAGNERKKIFGKFYRIGNEGTRTTPGTGLGLYLCKKIATDHKAQILVSDNSPAGSIFTVVF
jgi:two-component system, OmpR family, sensor histidine kinase CiaH